MTLAKTFVNHAYMFLLKDTSFLEVNVLKSGLHNACILVYIAKKKEIKKYIYKYNSK